MKVHLSRITLILLIIISAVARSQPLSINEGIYQDSETGTKVQVEPDRIPGIIFVRAGLPYLMGLWINIFTLDGYKNRFPNMQVTNLSPENRNISIDRDDKNLYRKTVNELDADRVEIIYEEGTTNSYSHVKFRLVVNTSTGQLEEFAHDSSLPLKTLSFWPRIGNLVLFKLRFHTGPLRRQHEYVFECGHLLQTDLQSVF